MEKKRRGGWPAREHKPGDRVQLSFRVTPERKAQLDQAAQKTGRSVMQEVELRLDRTFERDRTFREALTSVLGGPKTEEILITLAMFARPNRAAPDDAWLSDADHFHYVMGKWREYLAKIPTPPTSAEQDERAKGLESLIRLLGQHPRPTKLSLRSAELMFSQMHLDPDRAAKIASELARLRSQIDAVEVPEE